MCEEKVSKISETVIPAYKVGVGEENWSEVATGGFQMSYSI